MMRGPNTVVFLVLLFGNGCKAVLSRSEIINSAKSFCARSGVCMTNSSDVIMVQAASNVCCTGCSCDRTCIENENCCFPDKAYPVGNEDSNPSHTKALPEYNKTLVHECLYPASPQPTGSMGKIQQQSFWMVSEIIDNQGSSENQKCGFRNIAPWGSLLPVSSKKTGQIYKNIYCAKEHSLTIDDVVMWEVAIVCYMERKQFELTETIVDNCPIHFYAPREILLKRSSFCFNNLIDTCSEEVFNVPFGLTMNQSEFKDACTSGLVLPYRTVAIYANIFCHICNGYLTSPWHRCPSLSDTIFRSARDSRISGLIDINYLKQLTRDTAYQRNALKPMVACINEDVVSESTTGICRHRFCPKGQIRNSNGKCVYSVSRWFNINFRIPLQLISDKPFYFLDISQIVVPYFSNFRSPLLHSFQVLILSYKPHNFLNETNEFLVYLSPKSNVTTFRQMVALIKKNLKKEWIAHIGNTKVTFRSHLSKFAGVTVEMLKYMQGLYKELYARTVTDLNSRIYYTLTKLHFCENVRLEGSEFNISSQNIVFDKISNRYLYDAEYILAQSEQSTACYVCVDGSVFEAADRNNSFGSPTSSFNIFHIIISVLSSLAI